MKRALPLASLLTGLAAAAALAGELSLPAGSRALAVRIDALKCRYVDPGDRVDVLLTYVAADKERVTDTILQDIPVLSAKTLIYQVELTLAVPVKAADAYALAVKKGGTLTVAARAPTDHAVLTLETASFRRLFR